MALEVSSCAANEVARSEGKPFAAYFVWATVASFTMMILAAVVAAPLAQASHHLAFSSAIYQAFSFLCHQIPERSFHLAGEQFAVCSRCTGLYAGFALATLSYPLFRSLRRTDTPRIIWLFASAVPLAVDFSLTYFGIWQNNHFTRFTTGVLFGAVAAIFVLPGVIELSGMIGRWLVSGSQNHLR
ncbi:MAG TPA: DUF2085 domain-containing protein [Pyrinomonadaceae bacterium]|nr:DUF2085 domain-containing protein [Pyrinomonadaceae bacterium]